MIRLKCKQKPKAFTLVELLVVIAIIGILTTLAVVALQQARQNTRDSKRVADVKQTQMALELFYNEEGRYPTIEEWESGEIKTVSNERTFMHQIPKAPSVIDGDCELSDYSYQVDSEGRYYSIEFCTGKEVASLPSGSLCGTPGGIIPCELETILGGGQTFEGSSGTFTDSRDSQIYNWVRTGDQVWMADNLNYEREYAHCYAYDDENCDNYGRLYKHDHAMNSCPSGWCLPSYQDWVDLVDYVILNTSADSSNVAQWLKSCRQVNSSQGGACVTSSHPRWDEDSLNYGIDFYGFSIFPGGKRAQDYTWINLGNQAFFWTSSKCATRSYVAAVLNYNDSLVIIETRDDRSGYHEDEGMSVRCILDPGTGCNTSTELVCPDR